MIARNHFIQSAVKSAITGALLFVLGACQTAAIDRGSFGEFKRSLNNTEYGYLVITDPTGSAPVKFVERFEVQPGDCAANDGWDDCANDRERSELSERGNRNPHGETHWYGWSLYVPDDHINVFPTKLALGQFHQQNDHVVWMFQNGAGGIYLDDQVTGRTRSKTTLIEPGDLVGRWHRFEVHAKWTRQDDGFFRVWVNGVQKADYTGPTMSAEIVYFKYGVYRSFMSRYKNAHDVDEVPAQIAYFANVRRGATRDDIAPPAQAEDR